MVLIFLLLHRLFQEILESTSSTDIEFYQDGTWEPIMEAEGTVTLHTSTQPHTSVQHLICHNSTIRGFSYLCSRQQSIRKVGA